jgi:hypothetical protein
MIFVADGDIKPPRHPRRGPHDAVAAVECGVLRVPEGRSAVRRPFADRRGRVSRDGPSEICVRYGVPGLLSVSELGCGPERGPDWTLGLSPGPLMALETAVFLVGPGGLEPPTRRL